MRRRAMDQAYFDSLYARDSDPWGFATSEYEKLKYEATLAALPHSRYRSALEVGCSIGVFTRHLAERCDALIAIDPAERALDAARNSCSAQPQVDFRKMATPDEWPAGSFDLVVLSEVVYYFTKAEIGRLAARVADCLRPGGDVMLVHWLGETDYPLSGDDAVEAFIADAAPFTLVIQEKRTADYRLDLLRGR